MSEPTQNYSPSVGDAPTVVPDQPTPTLPPETVAPPSSGPFAVPTIPGFEMLDKLGEGGMGVVWKARQTKLNRLVALKMVLGTRAVESKDLIRFLAEAEAVAAIKHPNVVQVYEFGDHQGRPYLAMEYLDGGTLEASGPRERAVDSADTAKLLAKVSRGVAAAHEQGIVHRDLKPANVLLDAAGEPKVTDFGLAKRSTGTDLTATQAVMGTPAYMAPEQAQGQTKFVTPAADVWSLGVMLYERLTGQRPFSGNTAVALLRAVVHDDPPRPRSLLVGLPRDIELICLKCLSKDPTDRYPTAKELAQDLERFAAGEAVSVRAAGPVERAAKWARRKPTQAAAWVFGMAAVLLLAFGVTVLTLWQRAATDRDAAAQARTNAEDARGNEEKARRSAEEARDREESAKREAVSARDTIAKQRQTLAAIEYARTLQLAVQLSKNGDHLKSAEMINRTDQNLRGWEFDYLRRTMNQPMVLGHGWHVTPSFSSDGKLVATCMSQNLRTDHPARSTITVWDTSLGRKWAEVAVPWKEISAIGLNNDGSVLAVSNSATGRTLLWDTSTDRITDTLNSDGDYIRQLHYSNCGQRLAMLGRYSWPSLWNIQSGDRIKLGLSQVGSVRAIQFCKDGRYFATIDDTVDIWDSSNGTKRSRVSIMAPTSTPPVRTRIESASFSPDGLRLAATNGYKSGIWECKSGRLLIDLDSPERTVGLTTFLCFSSNGQMLATINNDPAGTTRLWDMNGRPVGQPILHCEHIIDATYSPDGKHLRTAGNSGNTYIWSIGDHTHSLIARYSPPIGSYSYPGYHFCPSSTHTSGADQQLNLFLHNIDTWDGTSRTLIGHGKPIDSVSMSPDGQLLASASYDRTARIWDAATGKIQAILGGNEGAVYHVRFSPDGRLLATAGQEGIIRVWTKDGKLERQLVGHAGSIVSIRFSPDGRRLVSRSRDNTIRVWSVATGKTETMIQDNHDWSAPVFDPQGKFVFAPVGDGVAVWGVADGQFQGVRFKCPPGSIQFSPDGRHMSVIAPKATTTWDVSTEVKLAELPGYQTGGTPHLSPDGQRIVAAGDRSCLIFDASTGVQVAELRGHTAPIRYVCFSPDGRKIISCGDDRTVRIWNTDPSPDTTMLTPPR